MGESQQEQLSLGFDARVRLEFVGSKITSAAVGTGSCFLCLIVPAHAARTDACAGAISAGAAV